MELSRFSQEANRGLQACSSWRLQFWKKQELQLQAGEDCLTRLEQMETPSEKQVMLAMARVASPPEATPTSRLAVMRRSLQALALDTSASLTGLAGLALALRDLSDPALRGQVERGLEQVLPAHPALKASAPSADWLLHQAARPEPRTGAEWSRALHDLPVRPALNELADPELKSFLRSLDGLELTREGRFTAERWCLTNLESKPPLAHLLDELPPKDVQVLGSWMLEQLPDAHPVSRLFKALPEPPYEAAGHLLLQPEFTLSGASRELKHRVSERQLVEALAAVEPENPTLTLLGQVSQLPALQAGLDHVELEPRALLEKIHPLLAPSESEALARQLATPATREFLDQVPELEGRANLALQALSTTDQPHASRAAELLGKTPLSDEDAVRLGQWMLEQSPPQAVTRLVQAEPQAAVYRAAAAQLDQPFSPAQAARDLSEHLPPERLVAALSAAEASPALTVLGRVSDPEVLRVGLQHLEDPITLLENLSPLLPPAEVVALVSSDDPLLEAVRSQPWPQAANQAAVVLAGCRALEQAPADPIRRTAQVALMMARATPDINEKLWLARAGLKAMDHPAAPVLLRLTTVDGPNATWSQAALALGALRCLTAEGSSGLRPVLETVSLAARSWAGPQWRANLHHALEQTPGKLGAVVRGSGDLDGLAVLLDDPILSAVSEERPVAAIAETPTHLVVAGVRVGKRNAGTAHSPPAEPSATRPVAPRITPALQLGPPPEPGEQVRLERKTAYMNGIAVVYNPISGEFEEKTSYKNGVGGVFVPETGTVEWQTSYKNGVGAAFNPSTGQVEWQTSYQNGVAGVYDPTQAGMQWRTSYKSGIAGLYQPATRSIKWETSYKNGIALATNDPEYPVRPLGPGF
ncbi:MAG: hypothetical protein AMXMBFR33_07120 [Candidatus Xenobia bacterium]